MTFSQNTVVVGLGSNLGDRMATLTRAGEALSRLLSSMRASPIYETPALLPENAPKDWDMPYLNMAVTGEASLPPEALLAELKKAERRLGREENARWGPRVIDLDLLAYGDATLTLPLLTLPHPDLLLRRFALQPLLDLWPEWAHPSGVRGSDALARLHDPIARVADGF